MALAIYQRAVLLTFALAALWDTHLHLASASGRLFKFPETPPLVLNDPNFRAAVGEPVMLTEYISKGQIDEGRRASAVLVNETLNPELAPLNNQGRITFSGYITVNKLCDSNLFFWFAPAKVE